MPVSKKEARKESQQPLRSAAEYYASFQKPDEEIVNGVVSYFKQKSIRVDSVVIQRLNDTQRAIVHRAKLSSKNCDLRQINWDIPELTPDGYEEYARTFYNFEGPIEIQERRARLLAETLGVQIAIIVGEYHIPMTIPSFGTILTTRKIYDELTVPVMTARQARGTLLPPKK